MTGRLAARAVRAESQGVPTIRLHSVRHSLATALNRAGVAPVDAAALLGHDVEVYLSTYVRPDSAGVRHAAAALGEAFAQVS